MNLLSKTHYELFGLQETFAIDRAALDSAYRKVQSAVHPDRFSAGTGTDRRIAMQLATHANEAYSTLKEPVARAAYLCSLHGVDPQVHTNTAMPGDFLVLQMDWRERLEQARDESDLRLLQSLRTELQARRDALIAALGQSIDAVRDYNVAAGLVRQLMFVDRFAEDLAMLEDQLELE